MAKTKGIRVNQLAKELGVPSKAILDRCKQEGLGEKVPNHMSLMSVGLAETVREWFAGEAGGVATAVETATEAAVEVATAKTTRRRRKAAEPPQPGEDDQLTAEALPEQETAEPEEPAVPPADEHRLEKPAPVADEPVEPELPAEQAAEAAAVADQAGAPSAAQPVAEAPGTEAEELVLHPPSTPAADAPQKPAAAPEAPGELAAEAKGEKREPVGEPAPRQPRPTVTLADRTGRAKQPAARKAVVPAPQLLAPQPARIQGPRIVREEKPDVVPTPRRRTPIGEGTSGPAFVQARPQGGRGVRSAEEETEDTEAKKKAGGKGRTLSSRRRGPDGRRGEAMEKLREYTEADLIERRDRLAAASHARATFDSHLKRAERSHLGPSKTTIQKGEPIEVEEPITVKSLSGALGVKTNDLLFRLMRQGVMANINQALDRDVAEALALDYGIELQIRAKATLEEELETELQARPVDPSTLAPRPPVVAILGHVDHGKTSLLDKIRSTNVAAGEAGGITQHVAAWMVQVNGKRVTFIDTPGHQAFTSMRARGADMTDVVVLVVSAAEGVQPQTIESINHARAAQVPIVVAMNKIDRPDANPDMVLGQLAAQGLNPVEWGGDTEVVRTSAMTGQGLPELIEILDYQSELLELKADPTTPAHGVVIESRVDEGMGAVATVLVQDGTLRVGDIVLSGAGYGRIRSLMNDRGGMVQEAGPATPVIVSGMNELPMAGDKFYVLDDLERARSIAEERRNRSRQEQLAVQNKVSIANLFDTMKAGQVKTINLIIKGDVQGSVETLAKTVTDFNTDEVKVRVIHAAAGAISESDVELAAATKDTNENTVIIGFHVVPDESARQLAEQRHVEIRLYRVIYEIFDDLKKALSGMLEPEIREKLHGHVEIRQVFKVSRIGNIAGCMVTDGHIQRGSKIRLIRDGAIVTEDLSIESLKRLKDDVKEVKAGFECGIKLAGYDDIKLGDRLEAYSREMIHRTL